MKSLCVQLRKTRGEFSLDATLHFPAGKVTALLGPSGSGKTTLLRLLAGLERADSGRIHLDEEVWLDTQSGIDLAIQSRKIGFMFQDYALFSHLTVAENIGYGVAKQGRKELVQNWLEKLKLEEFTLRYPEELSGGQRQRVALGRALAIEPKLLLLDEPFSALDVDLKKQLRSELCQYLREVKCPIVLVSHDIAEVRELADQVYLFSEGEVIRSGKVENVFVNPSSFVAAKTLGWHNFLPIEGAQGNTVYGPWGSYNLDHIVEKEIAYLAFQPHHARISSAETLNGISAVVTRVSDLGHSREVHLECEGGIPLSIQRFWDEPVPAPGSAVTLNVSNSHMKPLTQRQVLAEDINKQCQLSLSA